MMDRSRCARWTDEIENPPGWACMMLVAMGLLGVAVQPVMGQDAGTGVVTGTVEASSGPVEGANVVLVDSVDGASQTGSGDATGPDGRFRVEEVPSGSYTVRASLVGYEPARQSVRVATGDTATVDLALQQGQLQLDEVVVSGNRSLTQSPTAVAAAELRQVAGGTNLVSLADRAERPVATLADALEEEPGIVLQEFFGGNDQPRINIRGAGIQSNPQSRGLLLMHNGFPINFADGSFVAGLVEPRMARHAEVYRGGNALGAGAATLGGAVDFVAPTGRSAAGPQLKLTGGSFETVSGHAQYGWSTDDTDGFVMGAGHRHDGFRQVNDRGERLVGHANVGHRWTEDLETRIYGTVATLGFDIPGPLNEAQLEADPTANSQGVSPPTSLGPNVPLDQPRRDTELYRAATRTTWTGAGLTLKGGVAYQHVQDDFYFPVGSGVRSISSNDVTVDLKARRQGAMFGTQGASVLGVSATIGRMDRAQYANERGRKGRPFADNDMAASTVRAFAQQRLQLGDRFAVTAGVNGIFAPRSIDEQFDTPGQRPRYIAPKDTYKSFASAPTTLDETYTAVTPSLGLRYAVQPTLQVFGGVHRSVEPPTFNTLLSLKGGNPKKGPSQVQVSDLEAQSATTVEVGTRRTEGRLEWDVTAYRTWLKNELLTTAALFGGAGTTANAPVRTIHQGLETQVDLRLLDGLLTDRGAGDRLSMQTTYTLSDFYFDTDAQNQLAGVPRHRLHAQLTYEHPAGLAVEPNLTWMPQRTPTDHANTIYQDPYALLGARVHYTVSRGWFEAGRLTVFAEAENLADVAYASSYLVRDQVPDPPPKPLTSSDVTTFIPGQGRSFQLGVTMGW